MQSKSGCGSRTAWHPICLSIDNWQKFRKQPAGKKRVSACWKKSYVAKIKALAEIAALLVLQEKLSALRDDKEDE